MNLKTYLATLTDSDKQSLAVKLKTSVAYLQQLAGGHRQAGLKIVSLIHGATEGNVTQNDLRPDIFGPAPKKRRAA